MEKASPTSRLFLREHDVLDLREPWGVDFERTEQLPELYARILNGSSLTAPPALAFEFVLTDSDLGRADRLYEAFSTLAELCGPQPMWIVGFEPYSATAQNRAELLEMALRVAFSHPDIGGILLREFWSETHPFGAGASLVDDTWQINATGQRYERLLNEWTTTAQLKTDSNGQVSFRGYQGTYDVTMSRADGRQTTRSFTLAQGTGTQRTDLCVCPLEIAAQPRSQTVGMGQTVTLDVAAISDLPLRFQWYEGVSGDLSQPIAGATAASYAVTPRQSTDVFWVLVSNDEESIASASVTITVVDSRPSLELRGVETDHLVLAVQGGPQTSWRLQESRDAQQWDDVMPVVSLVIGEDGHAEHHLDVTSDNVRLWRLVLEPEP